MSNRPNWREKRPLKACYLQCPFFRKRLDSYNYSESNCHRTDITEILLDRTQNCKSSIHPFKTESEFYLSLQYKYLITVIDDWAKILDKGGQVDTFILDIEKAFDTNPHELLKGKLYGCGIVGRLLAACTTG